MPSSPAGPNDPHRDLAAVGDEHATDGLVCRTSRRRPGRSDRKERLPFLNRHAVLAVDGDDLSADAGLDVVHQLHHLDDAHRRRRVDGVRRRRRTAVDPARASARRCPATATRRRGRRSAAGIARRRRRRSARRLADASSASSGADRSGRRGGGVGRASVGAEVDRWTRRLPERTSISDQSERSNASTTRLIASWELLTIIPYSSPCNDRKSSYVSSVVVRVVARTDARCRIAGQRTLELARAAFRAILNGGWWRLPVRDADNRNIGGLW